jgi:hypothetical protein
MRTRPLRRPSPPAAFSHPRCWMSNAPAALPRPQGQSASPRGRSGPWRGRRSGPPAVRGRSAP